MVPIHAKLYVLLLLVVLPRSAKLQLQLGLVRPYIKNIQQAETECPPPLLLGCYIYRIALYGSFPGRTICWFCRIF